MLPAAAPLHVRGTIHAADSVRLPPRGRRVQHHSRLCLALVANPPTMLLSLPPAVSLSVLLPLPLAVPPLTPAVPLSLFLRLLSVLVPLPLAVPPLAAAVPLALFLRFAVPLAHALHSMPSSAWPRPHQAAAAGPMRVPAPGPTVAVTACGRWPVYGIPVWRLVVAVQVEVRLELHLVRLLELRLLGVVDVRLQVLQPRPHDGPRVRSAATVTATERRVRLS